MHRTQLLMIFPKFVLLLVFDQIFLHQAEGLEKAAIIGGNATRPGQFTYQVSLKLKDRYFCGGGIIDELFIITAAHCVTDYRYEIQDQIKVIAGTNNLFDNDDPRRVEVDVDKIYITDGYGKKGNYYHDIAVIRLKQKLQLKKHNLQKLLIPSTKTITTYAGKSAIVTGFGWDEITATYGGGDFTREKGSKSGQLHWANTQVLTNTECMHREYHTFLRDSHLCAKMIKPGLGPYGLCKGDSGSPLVFNWKVIIGVAITGPPTCNEAYYPGVYTRITSHLDFISNALRDKTEFMRTKVYSEVAPTVTQF